MSRAHKINNRFNIRTLKTHSSFHRKTACAYGAQSTTCFRCLFFFFYFIYHQIYRTPPHQTFNNDHWDGCAHWLTATPDTENQQMTSQFSASTFGHNKKLMKNLYIDIDFGFTSASVSWIETYFICLKVTMTTNWLNAVNERNKIWKVKEGEKKGRPFVHRVASTEMNSTKCGCRLFYYRHIYIYIYI